MASALFENFGTGIGGEYALRGYGVSLPASEGGFPVSFMNSNYSTVYKDCTLGPPNEDPIKHVPMVDLVVCDTTVMGYDKKTNFRNDIYLLKQELLARSLGAGLRKLKPGGSLLIRLQMQPSLFSLRVHSFLFELFDHFASVKPLKLFHMSREYYLLCRGFKRGNDGEFNPTDELVAWGRRDSDDPEEVLGLLAKHGSRLISLLTHCWSASQSFLSNRLPQSMHAL